MALIWFAVAALLMHLQHKLVQLSKYETAAILLQVRTLVQKALTSALQQYDLLLSPVAPTAAFKIGEKAQDPLAMYKQDLMTVHLNLAGKSQAHQLAMLNQLLCTCSHSLTLIQSAPMYLGYACGWQPNWHGLCCKRSLTLTDGHAGVPGISVPCGFDGNLPVGLQLIAPAFGEAALLETAHIFERTVDLGQTT